VVEAAARLADEEGFEALSLAGVAKAFGVAVPSLYKHVENLETLRAEVALLAVRELADRMRRAAVGRARGEALQALARAYRAYVLEHPGRYAATVRAVRADDPLGPQRLAALNEALEVVFAVLGGYGIEGDDRVDAARALRSAMHGFSLLEAAGGFGIPRDLERSFDAMIGAFDFVLSQWRDVGKADVRSAS
jgi:AcrR family transcriptional regulator